MSLMVKAQIVLLVFAVAAAVITPPDVISQLFVIVEMVIICGLLIFIVSRFKSFAQTPESIKRLIMVLVCLLSITISYSVTLFQYCHRLKVEQSERSTSKEQTKAENR